MLRPEQEYSEYTNQYINWNGLIEELKACINAVGGTAVVNQSQYEDSWRGLQLALSQLRSQLQTFTEIVNVNIGAAQSLTNEKGQPLGIATLDINRKLLTEQLPDITYGKLYPRVLAPQWSNIAFVNGWSNFGNGYETAQYMRIGNIVCIKGLITKATAPANGEVIGTIPVTCADAEFKVLPSFSYSNSVLAITSFFIQPNGSILYAGFNNYVGGAGSYFGLSNTFLTRKDFALFFGDSITLGLGATSNANRYSTKLAAAIALNEDNQGISGTVLQNSAPVLANNGQDTFSVRVVERYAKRVYILYGLNDLRFNGASFSVANFKNSLSQVVSSLLNNGGFAVRDIYIGSPPYMNPAFYNSYSPFDAGSTSKHLSYRDASREVASMYGINWVDIYQGMLNNGGNSLISADGIHPNNAGHQVIADLFASVL
jgi:lysophospholipase L1-like esterase